MNRKVLFIGVFLLPVLYACGGKEVMEAPVRNEFIKVYETSADKLVDNIQVELDGVQDGEIHVLSNVRLEWKYLFDQTETGTEWFSIKSVEEVEPGHTVVTYDAASLLSLNSLDSRSGSLSFSCPEKSLGKFLSIRQGYSRRFLEEFSDEADGTLVITGRQTYTTSEYPVLNDDYFDYISFNTWAVSNNEFMSKNITLDITISGGKFYDTDLATYRVNVPLGTGPEKSNLKYLLVVGNGERMSARTTFTFSTANDDQVFVHIDNFSAYQVTEADMGGMLPDEDFNEDEEPDWV